MKLKRYLTYMAFGLMATAFFSACDDEDNWQAGDPVDKNNIGAYFASSNVSSIVNTPEEFTANPTFTLTVCREVTTGAVTVPIEVVNNPGKMTVPSKVEFADGEAEATITIDYSGIPQKESCVLTLKLDDKMTNPYKVQDGLGSYSGSVLVSEWIKVGDQVPFTFRNYGLDPIKHDIYHLDGVNLFRIDNFFNTGVNFRFSITSDTKFDNSSPSTWSGVIEPESNFYMLTEWGCWYLLDDEDNYAKGQTGSMEMWYLYFWYGSGYGYIAFNYYGEGYNILMLCPAWDDKDSEVADSYTSYWDFVDAAWEYQLQ